MTTVQSRKLPRQRNRLRPLRLKIDFGRVLSKGVRDVVKEVLSGLEGEGVGRILLLLRVLGLLLIAVFERKSGGNVVHHLNLLGLDNHRVRGFWYRILLLYSRGFIIEVQERLDRRTGLLSVEFKGLRVAETNSAAGGWGRGSWGGFNFFERHDGTSS